ncbi:MAG: hypothetical protein QNK37_07245 [Acidobacteriota bacterium]|nr:hypothetical protein [Acidobacteriota bacterium]
MGDYLYQPFFCEENIYQLSLHPHVAALPQKVVFITNAAKTCAVWNMRAAENTWEPVLWDYHVILVVRVGEQFQVWDLDTVLGMPVPARHYFSRSFSLELEEVYLPRFRVLDGNLYRNLFSSDRSHMRNQDKTWLQPPPPWPPILNGPCNLPRFLDLEDPIAGQVMDLEETARLFCPEEFN